MKRCLLICCMLVSTSSMAQVYKCSVDGKTIYADAPCASNSKTLDIAPTTGPAASAPDAASAELDLKRRDVDRRLKIRAAIAAGEPMVSMSHEELLSAMGRPDRVNTGDYVGGTHDQLIYERSDRVYHVYVSNGVVTSFQTSERNRRRRAPCPSTSDIWNMEVEASKIGVRDTPYGHDLKKKIQDAKDCR